MAQAETFDSLPGGMQGVIILAAAGLGVAGFFTVFTGAGDLTLITGTWATMIVTLANMAGHKLERDIALKIVAAVLAGIGGFAAGVKTVQLGMAYTGVGTVPAMVLNGGANAVFTYWVGKSAAVVFLSTEPNTSWKEIAKAIARVFMNHIPHPHSK